jgi:hypothetical protein
MPVSVKIINTESQPNAGNAIVGVAGANGLGASGTLIKEMSSNNRLAPTGPYSASNLDISISNLDGRFSERFDDTNYYHGSGSYGGPS